MNEVQDRVDGQLGSIPQQKWEAELDRRRIAHSPTRGSASGFRNFTNEYDKIHGDTIMIHQGRVMRIDVKGRFVTRESILSFRGEYYVIYDSSNESAKEAYVISPGVLRDITKNWPLDYWELSAHKNKGRKEPGISFSRLSPIIDQGMGMKLGEFLNL